MKRNIPAFLLLAAILIAGTSCERDDATLDLVEPSVTTDGAGKEMTLELPVSSEEDLQLYLKKLWRSWDNVTWAELSGTINAQTGGTLSGVPSGWPAGYEISLEVPAGAIPSDTPGYPDVLFRIMIPAEAPAGTALSVPYLLEPDGIQFQSPARLVLCWPPWAGPAAPWYRSLCIDRHVEGYDTVFEFTDDTVIFPSGPTDLPVGEQVSSETLQATGITRDVWHFSRWELVNGDNEGEGGD